MHLPVHDEAARASIRLSYENLKQGRLEFATDIKTGRVFHNVSNMAKGLRRFLRLGGQPTVEIDLANAQPLFLLSLYPNDASALAEKRRFIEIIQAGLFYEAFNPSTGATLNLGKHVERERIKRAFQQQVLSGKNHYTGRVRDAFSSAFPILANAIEGAKKHHHAALSLRLQRVESNLVIHQVVGQLRNESPPISAVTIHDAILCAAKDANAVSRVFKEETHRLLGVVPTLHLTENTPTYHAEGLPTITR